ncbi:hypothetical protein BZA70DRAFT_289514 [Myxozyma melibiosi]|uniref:FYVE-type domain-containing protein n=1 Tax=Myxozyma melibiosi TaxID=54550 RepID=A0ABR1F6Y1_9ASCO
MQSHPKLSSASHPSLVSPSSSASSTASSSSTSSIINSPPKPLYRPAVLRYGTSLKVNDVDWSQQLFWGTLPPVTGPPSRAHWVPDDSVSSCKQCPKAFTFWERRHHCRRCGQIFCAAHSSHILRLDQKNDFHPSGTLSRTCDSCANDFNRTVIEALNSQDASLSNINYITSMVRNSNDHANNSSSYGGANLDLSDDEHSSAVTTPTAASTAAAAATPSYFSSRSATPEVIDGLDASRSSSSDSSQFMADSKAAALSRQIQMRVQQQLGGLAIPHQGSPASYGAHVAATPSDRTGSYVPTDWNWSTF